MHMSYNYPTHVYKPFQLVRQSCDTDFLLMAQQIVLMIFASDMSSNRMIRGPTSFDVLHKVYHLQYI